MINFLVLQTKMIKYVDFIYGRAQQDPDIYGINVNPASLNFSMNRDIMKNILDYRTLAVVAVEDSNLLSVLEKDLSITL